MRQPTDASSHAAIGVRDGGAPYYLGIFEGHFDPAVAIVRDGQVIAYAEEERFIRQKHANRVYPRRALEYCLQAAAGPQDIAAIGLNWNIDAYGDGRLASFFEGMARDWPLDSATQGWQCSMLGNFRREPAEAWHRRHWRWLFGDVALPRVLGLPHHFTHALHAFFQSPFDEAVCLTVDGSDDEHCTVLWHCRGEEITPLRSICMPHSLGWCYAAFTEYLGFEAYDGEYKVMGLAAYGRPDAELAGKLAKIIQHHEDGIGYRIDPAYIHFGPHGWSDRFTDHLPEMLGRAPRRPAEKLEQWHCDLAYAVQRRLEQAVTPLVTWAMKEAGTANLCIGGGVGLNVKMNSALFGLPEVARIFPQPLCSDGAAAAGAALGACWQMTSARPQALTHLALGPEEDDEAIEAVLKQCRIAYQRPADIAAATAKELALGRIVGWFQGRMEAGPRALGQRSILADPRRVEVRDRVNAVVKYREFWRPFCPSTSPVMKSLIDQSVSGATMMTSIAGLPSMFATMVIARAASN